MKINGKTVTGDRFAFEGCHKIYVIDTPEQEADARDYGYEIYPIEDIKQAYKDSCSLKFISSWPMNGDNFVSYVAQFEDAIFEGVKA
jgi:hypothetical protein